MFKFYTIKLVFLLFCLYDLILVHLNKVVQWETSRQGFEIVPSLSGPPGQFLSDEPGLGSQRLTHPDL